MEPEKFENNVKKVLEERELQPSAAGWEKLEQRLEKKKEKRPYLAWLASAAAIAAIFFVLGSYFNAPVPERSQLVEEPTQEPVFEEIQAEPEVVQLAVSEEQEQIAEEKKPSAERGVKNAIFEAPVSEASAEKIAEVAKNPSEAPEEGSEELKGLVKEIKSELASQDIPQEVNDHEIEALLLLASAQLEAEPAYSINPNELLDQVEYELDQSFRQKVFEVVKEGLLKAKTAVASDF